MYLKVSSMRTEIPCRTKGTTVIFAFIILCMGVIHFEINITAAAAIFVCFVHFESNNSFLLPTQFCKPCKKYEILRPVDSSSLQQQDPSNFAKVEVRIFYLMLHVEAQLQLTMKFSGLPYQVGCFRQSTGYFAKLLVGGIATHNTRYRRLSYCLLLKIVSLVLSLLEVLDGIL